MRVAVIGAGPAGATAAYVLTKNGVAVDLYEASPRVGGLARSFPLWNQTVDLGPHRFFSKDKRVNQLWLEVVGEDYVMVDRLTRILYRGQFFHYPLRPANALRNLGPIEATRCLASYARQSWRPTPLDGTFEAWVTHRFGRRLYEIFFKTYSEKLWGIPCTELDAAFAAQRIKKINLAKAIKKAFFKDFNQNHKTFVERFAYPRWGTGMVYQRMVDAVCQNGGRVFLETPVKSFRMTDNQVTALRLSDGSEHAYSQIVSSMPLSLLVRGLEGTPDSVLDAAASLRFRNTIIVYLRVESNNLFPDNWLYVHSPELQTGRVTNFRNWSPDLYGEEEDTILAMEFWANDDDPLWHADDESLINLARREIQETGLTQGAAITAGHVQRIKRCYPVYQCGYEETVDVIREYLDSIANLQAIGRYGAFKYNNQDHSILMGLLAAENVMKGAGHDLWAINTDYEVYQEEALITEAGLQNV
ncbi:MAG: FAD-dependent oxidoreductase [Candidatus Hydrogenedentota bacterium]